jgi:hypothetical protein
VGRAYPRIATHLVRRCKMVNVVNVPIAASSLCKPCVGRSVEVLDLELTAVRTLSTSTAPVFRS